MECPKCGFAVHSVGCTQVVSAESSSIMHTNLSSSYLIAMATEHGVSDHVATTVHRTVEESVGHGCSHTTRTHPPPPVSCQSVYDDTQQSTANNLRSITTGKQLSPQKSQHIKTLYSLWKFSPLKKSCGYNYNHNPVKMFPDKTSTFYWNINPIMFYLINWNILTQVIL